jgi:hypothetical protein
MKKRSGLRISSRPPVPALGGCFKVMDDGSLIIIRLLLTIQSFYQHFGRHKPRRQQISMLIGVSITFDPIMDDEAS